VPGVGKQTAARLLLELRARLAVPADEILPELAPSVVTDVRDALAGLGYGNDEVREALRDLDVTGRDAASLLREALQALGSRRAG
jgi:Holliday junction DNA helicase RuvA